MAKYFARQGYRTVYLSLTDTSIDINKVHKREVDNCLECFFKRTNEGIYILKEFQRKFERSHVEFGFEDLLQRLENECTPADVAFIVACPDWVDYLTKITNDSKLIYDCLDNWETFITDLDLGYNEITIHHERKLASLADLIIVSSKSLYVKMAPFNDHLYYLPNGVWNADYSKLCHIDTVPNDIKNIKKPIVFFMGAIAGWVDIELIRFLAESRPEYSFVFVGTKMQEELPECPNIYYLGKKKYEELPLYLKQAKVAIIPFKVNKLTAAVTPLKFYEYLSSATPVVTTVMPDLIGLQGSKMAQNYEEFLKYLDAYISMDEEQYQLEALRAVQTSKSFDWSILLEPLCSFIDGKDFEVLPKNDFMTEMIKTYQTLQGQDYIKNELITLYNSTGQYQMSCSLFGKDENIEEKDGIDLHQLSLAYFKQGDIEYSIRLLKMYLNGKDKLLQVYVESISNDENRVIFLELFLLKICGFIYDALRKADELYLMWRTNPKFLGMVCSLYMDVGEYDLAFQYGMEAIDVGEKYGYEEILDFYSLSFLISELCKLKKYDAAESIALSLTDVNEDWEEQIVKILADLYFIREFDLSKTVSD